VQVVRTVHGAGVLIIRRSWVRAPPAPPAISLEFLVRSWTGSSTSWLAPERTHRVTDERILTRQGIRRNRPAQRPGDRVPQGMQDRAGRADRTRQAARDGPRLRRCPELALKSQEEAISLASFLRLRTSTVVSEQGLYTQEADLLVFILDDLRIESILRWRNRRGRK